MTTPERLRRRQRIEGIVLILLAIFTTLQAVYFSIQNNEQNDCVATVVTKLNRNFEARAKVTQADSDVKKRAITHAFEAQTREQFLRVKAQYLAEQKRIDLERKQHPVPPLPPGRCQK